MGRLSMFTVCIGLAHLYLLSAAPPRVNEVPAGPASAVPAQNAQQNVNNAVPQQHITARAPIAVNQPAQGGNGAPANVPAQQFNQQNNHVPQQQPTQQHSANNQQQNHQPPAPVDATTILSEHPDCKDDIKRLCPQNPDENKGNEQKIQHNFEVLDCFMSYEGDEEPPSSSCQALIYQYKLKLTTDDRFESAAREVCKGLISSYNVDKHCQTNVKGGYLPCLMEIVSYEAEDDEVNKNCFVFLNKMQRIIFSDYHLVHQFQTDCANEIKKLSCWRLFENGEFKEENVKHHNQGPVIDCLLQADQDKIGDKCQLQINRVAELQSEDYHLDRPLFFACRADRDKFCPKVESGNGQIYRCLMENQQSGDMNPECVKQLIKREKLMQEDMKADITFFHSCKDLLKESGCWTDSEHTDKTLTMSRTLICLMDYEANSDKELEMTDQCEREITLFQENLMNEYKISAEIVTNCETEIQEHCKGMKKAHEKDGTVHCLMALATPTNNDDNKRHISEQCETAVRGLLDETRPASILAIDGFLMEQCATQLNKFCQHEKHQLDCLMDQIRNGKIEHTAPCAKHLLELEYFISRNYKHDMRLVKACHKSITDNRLDHHLKKQEQGAPSDGIVFAQLYKLTREQLSGETLQHPIEEKCITEVLRCVHERAVSIDLNPELEEKCLPFLTTVCNEAQHGEELGCLEEHLDKIPESSDPENSPGCREMLEDYIKAQDADYQLDYILMKSCEPSIKKHCEDVLAAVGEGKIDDGAIIECLIEHKFDEDMDEKCFTGIQHHQIINMQDFNFNTKFRENCKKDFEANCHNVKSKADVVYCLSEMVRNDTLLESEHRVSQKCRHQLQAELLALEDTIELDKKFEASCKSDLKKHCDDVKPHPDADSTDLYLTCIRAVDPEELEKKCAKYVFKVAELQNAVAGASAHIFRQCKTEIKKFCKGHTANPETLLGCLDENYEESSPKCQKALDEEEEEDNEDIRLNPALYMPCKKDINEFCAKEMNRVHDTDESLHGAVINCLKLEYLKGEKSELTHSCANQMHLLVVKVQTRDYKQDYVLTHQCKKEIKQCSHGNEKGEKHILDCLKKKLFAGELKDDLACQAEVFRLITENRVDIHTDGDLYEACRRDIQESACKGVEAGSGRVMSCLLSLYAGGLIKSTKCKTMVTNRKDLWEQAAKMSPPETLSQVWNDMSSSDSRWYFMSVISAVILVILIVGVLCGRASKRLAAEVKNR